MSIFEGKLEEIPEITIDRFEGERNLNDSTAYFLTHCHTDHMIGLGSEAFRKALFERDGVFLYTSKISYCILKNHKDYRHLTSKIKSLPSDKCKILSIPSLTDNSSFIDVQVTLIPAGHCPGSVMFFFELQQGNVLYTGDFRFSCDDICSLAELHHKEGTPKEISSLYLDATFFDDLYQSFPKREESFEEIYNLTKEWLEKSPCNEVSLDVPAQYGSEFIFCELKKKLGMKVHVSSEKVNTFRGVKEISTAITDDRRGTRIHACSWKRMLPTDCRRNDIKFLTIRVSCMWYEKEYADKGAITGEVSNYTRVCYACHCSKEELADFIQYFVPKKVAVCAIPRDKTPDEVEKEIMDLIRTCHRSRRSTDSSGTPEDHKINYSTMCQIKRKLMSSPRKRRRFVPLSQELSSDESPPCLGKAPYREVQASYHEKVKTGDTPSIYEISLRESDSEKRQSTSDANTHVYPFGEPEQASEKTEGTGSSYESELGSSPSLLPQLSRKIVDPSTHSNWSPECYIVCRSQEETEIEVITLSSDESPEILVME